MIKEKKHLKAIVRTNMEKHSRKGCLRLDMNENVSGLPEKFVKEIFSNVNPGYLATYPEYKRLKEKIAIHNGLKPENICLSNGSDAAIKYIFEAYISPNDKVLITDPAFAMYQVYCDIFNAKPVKVEYNRDLSFPKKKFLGKISKDIKMAVIVNPNNPTGSLLNKHDLIDIVKKSAKNNILVIISVI